jgi:hypothetical protein
MLANARSGFSLLARLETMMEETVPMIFHDVHHKSRRHFVVPRSQAFSNPAEVLVDVSTIVL